MANLFKNPLVVAETVVGSMIDLRNVVLYAQPEEITKLPYNITVDGNKINFHERALKNWLSGPNWWNYLLVFPCRI